MSTKNTKKPHTSRSASDSFSNEGMSRSSKKRQSKSGFQLDRKKALLYAGIILLIGFLLYARAIGFNYVYNDDNLFILDEPYKTLNSDISNIPKTFTQGLTGGGQYYRPLLSISWIIDAQFAGDDAKDPAFYHFSNIMFHVIGSVLMFIALLKLRYDYLLSLLFGLLFVVHPILTPSACWISGRNDSILAVFVLLSFISLINFKDSHSSMKWLWYFLCILFFAMSIFTKEVGAFFFAVGAFYLYSRDKKSFLNNENIAVALGWTFVSIVWYVMRHEALKGNPSPETIGLEAFVENYPTFFAMLGKMILPIKMAPLSSYEAISVITGVVFVIASGALFFISKELNKQKALLGVIIYVSFVTLPLFVRLPGAADYFDYVEHRAFLPLFGIFILIIEAVKSFKVDMKSKVFIGVFAGIILLFGIRTVIYQSAFDNRFNYWRNIMNVYPHKGRAYFDYAKAYMEIDSLDKAEQLYFEGLQLSPGYKGFYIDLSYLYSKRRDYEKAERMARKALELDPRDANANLNLGQALSAMGKYKESIPHYLAALPKNANKPEMYISLGLSYFRINEFDKAINEYSKALQINPNYALGYSNLASAYFSKREFDKAHSAWMKSMQLDPKLDANYNNLIIYYTTVENNHNAAKQILQKAGQEGIAIPQGIINMIK